MASDAYVFYYFEGYAGERGGLYAACSTDLVTWRKLGEKLIAPSVGEWGVFRDPSVIRDRSGIFHLVWTAGESGFGYARSEDGLNWVDVRFVPVTDPSRGLDFVNVWAPELLELDDGIHVIWSSTLASDYEPPKEPDKWWTATWNHRLYYTVTHDFTSLAPTEQFWDPGFNCIDAAVFPDGDDYYLFFKDERKGHKNIMMGRADRFAGPYTDVRPITGELTEGPTVVKRGGTLFLYYDYYQGYNGYRYRCSDDMKTFTEERLPVKEGFTDVMRHGSIVTVPEDVLRQLRACLQSG